MQLRRILRVRACRETACCGEGSGGRGEGGGKAGGRAFSELTDARGRSFETISANGGWGGSWLQ